MLAKGKLVFPHSIIKGDILISGTKITRVAPRISASAAVSLTVEGFYISPGFIDLHVHGGAGFDFLDASHDGNKKILDFVSSHGTTYLLPTIATAPLEGMIKAAKTILELCDARVGGIYFEGPFLSPQRKGAQPDHYFLPPSLKLYKELRAATGGKMKILALAPELSGAKELIAEALKDGVIVALAHSDASYEEVSEAIELGVRHFTHLCNGMRVFHHRDPGALVAALLSPNVTAEIIADGIHVHPAVVKFVIKVKGSETVCLVTDAIRAAGLEDGSYKFSDYTVIVRQGIARLADADSLAGSTLTIDQAIRNLVEWGVALTDAVRMASQVPARVLGIDHAKGSLSPEKDADIVVLDRDFNVRAVFAQGKVVYNDLDERLERKEKT
ncbi:MAG: N-acetylglucosamine-6-phosphate deacetylase [Thermosphaera sp.]